MIRTHALLLLLIGFSGVLPACMPPLPKPPTFVCPAPPSASARTMARALTELVRVAPGTFTMGSPQSEAGRPSFHSTQLERQHEVTISRGFLIQPTEVTQADWEALMGFNPSQHSCSPEHPVESITFYQALAYANLLSAEEGLAACYDLKGCNGIPSSVDFICPELSLDLDCEGYRLPTEAEWEYAARAGSEWAFSNGILADPVRDPNLERIAWYRANAARVTHPVALLAPNDLGLYDISGNVAEMTWDYAANYPNEPQLDPVVEAPSSSRIARGGNYAASPGKCRLASRLIYTPNAPNPGIGLRLVRTISSSEPAL